MKLIAIIISLIMITSCCYSNSQSKHNIQSKHNVVPKDGYIPNKETAIKIAVAAWEPIYGKEKIRKQQPYKVKLVDDKWIVTGTFPKKHSKGGVAIAEIDKKTGKVLRISHGK